MAKNKARKQQENTVVDLDTGNNSPVIGHNSTLHDLLARIDSLPVETLMNDCVGLARECTQYLVGLGNGNSQAIARLFDRLAYLGKRGACVKYKQWVMATVKFEYSKGPDGKAIFRKSTKRDPLAIHNAEAWDQGFMEYEPEPKDAADWTPEAHIRRAIKRLVVGTTKKPATMTEHEARELLAKIAHEVPLKTVDVDEGKTTLEILAADQAPIYNTEQAA